MPTRKAWLAYGITAIIMGVVLISYGYLNYYNAICNCPAQIVGMPSQLCHCINQYADKSIFSGILILSIGIWWTGLRNRR